MADKYWVAGLLDGLEQSLSPVPHEVNELDWKLWPPNLGQSCKLDKLAAVQKFALFIKIEQAIARSMVRLRRSFLWRQCGNEPAGERACIICSFELNSVFVICEYRI